MYIVLHRDDEEIDNPSGRPVLSVDMYEVEFLRSLGFSWTDIATCLNISRSTLYRRLRSCHIPLQGYSDLSDSQVDQLIRQIKRDHPNDGEIMISAHLRSRGYRIPRSRLRAAIHRLDPSVHNRLSSVIRRRVYHVDSPNSVWHIDGNHKLIRWRFVVHSGIDGYSRLVVFLKCATNNKAETMLSAFINGVESYGLPNKVRSDLGGENVQVWRYVQEEHNDGFLHVIVGSSTHNERIERLWRDVHRCVLQPFANKFYSLEQSGLLDPLNEIDIFCLHFCYGPRINNCLASFQDAWNNHSLSTEHNATPYQLFVAGFLTSGLPDLNMPCGIQCSLPDARERVTVPRSSFHPCSVLQHQVQFSFDPLTFPNYFDDGLYLSVTSYIGQHLESNCQSCIVGE